ncbi:ArsR family transcriptional regulator [Streptomyces sp. NPDC005017]|uniref:ArsR family transcriptional regulator n=1 Tax=Streptomyces sp. NPDC005017 TaxID=3364706 RepID=UPI0036C83D22
MELLKDPARHFPAWRQGDPAEGEFTAEDGAGAGADNGAGDGNGVCAGDKVDAEEGVTAEAVAVRLGLGPEAAATHLRLLADLGLLRARRVRRRVRYRRDEVRIAEVARMFEKGW